MGPDMDLRDELLARGDRDQQIRLRRLAQEVDDAAVVEVDRENSKWLSAILDRLGWPGVSLVGSGASRAAWALAQHADHDPAFQRRCLDLMASAVAEGEAEASDLAYLTDRVLLKEQSRQVFGTQCEKVDGQFLPDRLDEPETVDDRRAAAGLAPLAEYLESMSRLYRAGPMPKAWITCRGCGQRVDIYEMEWERPVEVVCGTCGHACTHTFSRLI